MNEDLMTETEIGKNAMGGTEIIKQKLFSILPRDLLQEFQIFFSRVEVPLDETKIRIFYAHDVAGDPGASHAIKDIGYDKFHRFVFVSNHQMQEYIKLYNLPWSKCIVLQNAIEPIEDHEKPEKLKLIYFSTPQRGLKLLVPVFKKIAEENTNVELDVYSSFKIYGWEDRDKQFEDVYNECRNHPQINYYGSVSNQEIREALTKAHILAYPSIWPETSCLTLLESMSAGLICVHPNLGALPETASNWTLMYQYHEDANRHAGIFYNVLKGAIDNYSNEVLQAKINPQKSYINAFYNWDRRKEEWKGFLLSLLNEDRKLVDASKIFSYKR